MSTDARAPLVPGIRILRMLWRMLPPILIGGNLVAAAHLLGASDELKHQALVVALFIVGFTLVMAVVKELLSPHRPRLRIIRVSDYRAERLAAVAKALLFVLLGTELAIYLVNANGWSPALAGLLALLRNVGLLIFTWSALNRSGLIKALRPAETETTIDAVRWLLVRFVVPFAFLTALLVAVSYAFGYEALSRWVVKNAGWTAVIIVLSVLTYRWFRMRLKRMVAFLQAEETETAAEEAEAEQSPAREPSPVWIGVERIAAGALKIAFLVGAFFVVLNVWELSFDGLKAFLAAPIISGWGPTYGGVASAVVSIAIVLIVGAFLKNLLIFILFPRTGTDVGARYAILAILRYTMWIIAALMALDALGVETSTFAVFAGAFGVGLAFGLQDIFANFFAGLIMLLERPVRVGDVIEVGGSSGRVEAIKLRGTLIRTFDNTTIMIPNRQLIGERLSNLTWDMNFARMQLDVGVTYDADPREVERILLGIARREPKILHDPAPFVRFTNFGDSSLDFSLRCYTADTGGRWGLASELRTRIFEELKKADVEIPFPQRDIHIRTSVSAELPTSTPPAEAGPGGDRD